MLMSDRLHSLFTKPLYREVTRAGKPLAASGARKRGCIRSRFWYGPVFCEHLCEVTERYESSLPTSQSSGRNGSMPRHSSTANTVATPQAKSSRVTAGSRSRGLARRHRASPAGACACAPHRCHSRHESPPARAHRCWHRRNPRRRSRQRPESRSRAPGRRRSSPPARRGERPRFRSRRGWGCGRKVGPMGPERRSACTRGRTLSWRCSHSGRA